MPTITSPFRPAFAPAPRPLATWFGVGGGASRFESPATIDELRTLLGDDPDLRIIGEGANLLVDDDGVDGLVVSLERLSAVERTSDDTIRVGAGVPLMRLVVDLVRERLAGLESLAGIPASIGGAVTMNAGGRFGEIADITRRIHAIDRDGNELTIERNEIAFGYRHSGLGDLIVTGADLAVRPVAPDEGEELRARLKEIMAYKGRSQPMGSHSAGCVFRNPTLEADLDGIGDAGQRVSAGLLIDRAGCKGLAIGGASVSARHANFITTSTGAQARDVIELIELVKEHVEDEFNIGLETEVVIWRKGDKAS